MKVYPVMGFPDPAIVSAAERLVSDHRAKFSQTSRILQQVLFGINDKILFKMEVDLETLV